MDNNVVSDLLKYHTVLRQVAHLLWSERYTVFYKVCALSKFVVYHQKNRKNQEKDWASIVYLRSSPLSSGLG